MIAYSLLHKIVLVYGREIRLQCDSDVELVTTGVNLLCVVVVIGRSLVELMIKSDDGCWKLLMALNESFKVVSSVLCLLLWKGTTTERSFANMLNWLDNVKNILSLPDVEQKQDLKSVRVSQTRQRMEKKIVTPNKSLTNNQI